MQEDLHGIEVALSFSIERKYLRKARRALRYLSRSEGKAEQYLRFLKNSLVQYPELASLAQEITVSDANLIKAFSLYDGDFRDQLKPLLKEISGGGWFQSRALTPNQHEKIIALVHALETSLQSLVPWVQGLDAALKKLKDLEIDFGRRSLLQNVARTGGLIGVDQAVRAVGVVGGLLTLLSSRTAEARSLKFRLEVSLSRRNNFRPLRPYTKYIILHTTEGGDRGALPTVKKDGLAHFLVKTDGTVYQTIESQRIAKHAGRSIWNNFRNIDDYSVGIEVVGYHNKQLTKKQITALKELISYLQKRYSSVMDADVLTHSMVAYGAPNRYHRKSHRGRKRCGMLMGTIPLRTQLGLNDKPGFDPDVRAGRLVNADPYLASVLYPRSSTTTEVPPPAIAAPVPEGVEESDEFEGFKVVKNDNDTAFALAGDEYGLSTTIYFLPSGIVRTGVQLLQGRELFKVGEEKYSGTWLINHLTTLKGTKVLVGYVFAGQILADRSPYKICGEAWNHPSTVYYHPKTLTVTTGDQLNDDKIPVDTWVFFRN